MGDATVLARLMRSAHASWPAVPQLVVAKEISREDVRLGLEKMADRFLEHPTTVLVITNLHYADAPGAAAAHCRRRDAAQLAGAPGSRATPRTSTPQQIEALHPLLDYGWATRPSETSGNPVYVRPSVLVIYREDHAFLLDARDSASRDAGHRLRLRRSPPSHGAPACRRSSRWARCCCRWCAAWRPAADCW